MSLDVDHMAFGIGCLHFGPAPAVATAGTLTWTHHFQHVVEALQALGATDVCHRYEEEARFDSVPAEIEPDRIFEGGGATPIRGTLGFTLRVPASFQRAEVPYREPSGEIFSVTITYGYFMPMAFVVADDPDDPSPSIGVRLVREYLEKQLVNDNVIFDFLGPSPFHADCFLQPREQKDPPDPTIQVQRTDAPGYDRLDFTYDPGAYDLAEAARVLRSQAALELSFYYQISWVENGRIREWFAIRSLLDDLVALQKRKGFRGYVAKLWGMGRLTTDAVLELAAFQSELVHSSAELERAYDDVYGSGSAPLFNDYVEDAMRHQYVFPAQDADRLVSSLDARRGRTLENLALMLGPLVGVVVGFLISLVAR